MAGDIENTQILEALNQGIKAINDLATAVGNLVLQTTVNEGDCIPEINFLPNITCYPVVTCTSYATVAPGAFGGTEVAAPSGTEGGEPPPGYTYPDPETEDRKCKVANFIVDSAIAVIDKLDVWDVDQYAAGGFILCAGLVGAVLGSELPIAGTLIGLVAGAIVGLAVVLVTGGAALSFDDMRTILTDYREDFVCGLWLSEGAQEASYLMGNLMSEHGGSEMEVALLSYLVPTNLTNLLFFTIPEYEATLDGWEVTTECTCE